MKRASAIFLFATIVLFNNCSPEDTATYDSAQDERLGSTLGNSEPQLKMSPNQGNVPLSSSLTINVAGGSPPYTFDADIGSIAPTGSNQALYVAPNSLTGDTFRVQISIKDSKSNLVTGQFVLENHLEINSGATGLNLFVLAGSPVAPRAWVFKIKPSVVIGSTDTAKAAVATGVFPSGSLLTLINSGSIQGKGGNGGAGTNCGGGIGAPGGAGGPAIEVNFPITIDNTQGQIYGGGGGGAGGGSYYYNGLGIYPGDGGGGGQGFGSSSGGGFTPGCGWGASPGSGGSATSPGEAGGAHRSRAGRGGAWGRPGTIGDPDSGPLSQVASFGAAGAPGAALKGNGNSIKWIGKGDVKGIEEP